MASNRTRKRNTGIFRSAHAPEIAELVPALSHDIAAEAHSATAAMVAFDREPREMTALPFAAVLLRGESATSSQIENLTVRARKLSLAAVGARVGGNAELVARNVAAMRAAIDAASQLDSEAIRTMHRELTEGVQDDAGKYRNEWVWIGGDSPVTASFVAPEHPEVPGAIADLVRFLARRDLDPTVHAAIAHAQFETIHPFTDGNGRTGRALVSSLLRARGTVENLSIPISSGLLHGIDDYIGALDAYRAGDPGPIVASFAQAVLGGLANASLLMEDIDELHSRILESRPRITTPLRAVARLCCTEPAFTASMVENLAGVSKPTAYRTVDVLTRAGILRAEHERVRGQRVWTVPGLNQALDRFAERAGRRTSGV